MFRKEDTKGREQQNFEHNGKEEPGIQNIKVFHLLKKLKDPNTWG